MLLRRSLICLAVFFLVVSSLPCRDRIPSPQRNIDGLQVNVSLDKTEILPDQDISVTLTFENVSDKTIEFQTEVIPMPSVLRGGDYVPVKWSVPDVLFKRKPACETTKQLGPHEQYKKTFDLFTANAELRPATYEVVVIVPLAYAGDIVVETSKDAPKPNNTVANSKRLISNKVSFKVLKPKKGA